jgi:hypothetical protein
MEHPSTCDLVATEANVGDAAIYGQGVLTAKIYYSNLKSSQDESYMLSVAIL